jgi:hypothetical protein
MLHSKVYYMELESSKAVAFIGSHNMTSFALTGLNGEAAVMIEGPIDSPEFDKVRDHIQAAQSQAVEYSSGMKEAYAWWAREFIEGLRGEMRIPQDWSTVRTILLFARAAKGDRPKTGDQIYFEIPSGIEQIDSFKTETHLFLFDALPANPSEALRLAHTAVARYTCKTLGAENRQGNLEVVAQWRIDGMTATILTPVPSEIYRPNPPAGMQQVRAEVETSKLVSFDYLFEREKFGWDPELSSHELVLPSRETFDIVTFSEARGANKSTPGWKLVKGLIPRLASKEKDEEALKLAAPDSGSFILVSLRRRPKDPLREDGDVF